MMSKRHFFNKINKDVKLLARQIGVGGCRDRDNRQTNQE